MLILLGSTFFISRLLAFLICILPSSHSNSEDHSYNFLKFHKSMTNMMRTCLVFASPVLLTSHNLLQGYFNDDSFQLHQKDPDIGSQKSSLFWAYGKFGCSLSQIYASFYIMICSKDFCFFLFCFLFFLKLFSMIAHSRQTKMI